MELIIFFNSFVQNLNSSSSELTVELNSEPLDSGDSLMANGSDASDANDTSDVAKRVDYDDTFMQQSVLMIPLMLPHMRLLLELCLGISAVCLIMHLIVYGFVPKLRNTPGKCLMSLSVSLLAASITFVASLHIPPSPTDAFCVTIAITRLYTFLGN